MVYVIGDSEKGDPGSIQNMCLIFKACVWKGSRPWLRLVNFISQEAKESKRAKGDRVPIMLPTTGGGGPARVWGHVKDTI